MPEEDDFKVGELLYHLELNEFWIVNSIEDGMINDAWLVERFRRPSLEEVALLIPEPMQLLEQMGAALDAYKNWRNK